MNRGLEPPVVPECADSTKGSKLPLGLSAVCTPPRDSARFRRRSDPAVHHWRQSPAPIRGTCPRILRRIHPALGSSSVSAGDMCGTPRPTLDHTFPDPNRTTTRPPMKSKAGQARGRGRERTVRSRRKQAPYIRLSDQGAPARASRRRSAPPLPSQMQLRSARAKRREQPCRRQGGRPGEMGRSVRGEAPIKRSMPATRCREVAVRRGRADVRTASPLRQSGVRASPAGGEYVSPPAAADRDVEHHRAHRASGRRRRRHVCVDRTPAERPRQEGPVGVLGAVLRCEQGRATCLRSTVVVPPPAVVDAIRDLPEGERSVVLAAQERSRREVHQTQSQDSQQGRDEETAAAARVTLLRVVAGRRRPDGIVDPPGLAHRAEGRSVRPRTPGPRVWSKARSGPLDAARP